MSPARRRCVFAVPRDTSLRPAFPKCSGGKRGAPSADEMPPRKRSSQSRGQPSRRSCRRKAGRSYRMLASIVDFRAASGFGVGRDTSGQLLPCLSDRESGAGCAADRGGSISRRNICNPFSGRRDIKFSNP